MFSERRVAKPRYGCGALEWLQLPNRDHPQTLAARHAHCGGADHLYGPLSRQLEDDKKDCARSALDGLAALVPKRAAAQASATKGGLKLFSVFSGRFCLESSYEL